MRTARRRWSKELEKELDGIAFASEGPVLIHGYDAPAEGMWIDDVIPGTLGALDRHTGERLWLSPCEVGYGRGFGAGFDREREIVVLGPSARGHLAIRVARENGRILGAESIEAFDDALVHPDLCVCVNARGVFAISTTTLATVWEYSREGERYHHVARCGQRALVVFSLSSTGRQGVLALDARTGQPERVLLPPEQESIHGLAGERDEAVVLTSDLYRALPAELASQFLEDLSRREEESATSSNTDTLSLLGLSASAEEGQAASWFEILARQPSDSLPECSITVDSGKLYLASGAVLEVRDLLTGRPLGGWTIPGLDEHVAWQVCDGAGLLAEEHRISVFELPA